MRTPSLFLFLLLAIAAKAEFPPRIAASERIVTLEQWGGRGNDAIVWAVRPTELIIYHVFSSTPDEILATVPLKKEVTDVIRASVSEIKKSARGKVWFDANVMDGDLRADRIEVANHWRPEFQKLIELVSSASPEKWKIRFRERIAHLEREHKADIQCVSVKKYYGEK
jgi:hypothetical protein